MTATIRETRLRDCTREVSKQLIDNVNKNTKQFVNVYSKDIEKNETNLENSILAYMVCLLEIETTKKCLNTERIIELMTIK